MCHAVDRPPENNKTIPTMTEPTTDSTAHLLADIFRQCLCDGEGRRKFPEGLSQPVTVVQPGGQSVFGRIIRANAAWLDLVGCSADEVDNVTMLHFEADDDGDAADTLQEHLGQAGYGVAARNLRVKGGETIRVETTAVRLPAWPELDTKGDVLIVVDQLTESVVPAAGGAALSQSQTVALQLETLLRRYIRENYRQGMHPAQWSALRYFKLAPPESRSLTGFAKAHHTTMGTASTTVSTLVGKGYLYKQSFRGQVNLTKEGEKLLRDDPLRPVVSTLGRMSAFEREWTEYVLATLTDSFANDDN
jgi:DNA-binding MarR family transcriptional regulator